MKKTHVSVVLDANQSALLGSFIKGKLAVMVIIIVLAIVLR